MNYIKEVAELKQSVTALLSAINVKKILLDTAVDAAAAYAASARVAEISRIAAETAATLSTAQAEVSTASEVASTTQAEIASAKALAAAEDAGVATMQAGISTDAKDIATSQAVIATDKAATATEGASIATSQANVAVNKASEATSQASAADSSATASNISAGQSAGSAAQALAIYGTTNAFATALSTAQSQVSVAAGYATSAGSAVQQDLSGVTAAALHRSPNAVNAMFIYDTSKDSDGGAWRKRMGHTSWMNEPLAGKWLGAFPNEAQTRLSSGTLTSMNKSLSEFGTNGGQTSLLVSGNSLTATYVTGAPAWVSTPITSLVIGNRYKLNAILSGTYSSIRIGTTSASGIEYGSGNPSTPIYFIATATTMWFSVAIYSGSATINDYQVFSLSNVDVVSGDYFQLGTDGKFYRLWKNLLSNSESPAVFSSFIRGGTNSVAAITPPAGIGATAVVAFTEDASTSNHVCATGANGTVNSVGSLYVKAAGRTKVLFGVAGGVVSQAQFDLSTGLFVGSANGVVATSVGDGWYRLSRVNASGTGIGANIYAADSNGNFSYLGDGRIAFYVTAAQFEENNSQTVTAYEPKLVGVGSTSETFRGNKAEFPALSSIVAEAGSVTIYDLTAPGNPMWMRFASLGGRWVNGCVFAGGYPLVAVAALSSVIAVGSNVSDGGLTTIDFSQDRAIIRVPNSNYGGLYKGSIANRQSFKGYNESTPTGFSTIVNPAVNAVAMTVLPDAPFDAVTGLQIPTIAVGTNNGLSVIKSDGSVVNISNTFYSNFISISFDVRGGISCVQITSSPFFSIYAHYPNIPASNLSITATSFGVSGSYSVTGLLVQPQGGGNQNIKTVQASRTSALSSDIGLNLMKKNISTPSSSLLARLSNTYNTGYLVGDIRRAWLADNSVGSITASELVTNGTFDADISGWVAIAGVASFESGKLKILNDTAVNAIAANTISNLIVDKTYLVVGEISNNNIQAKLTINGLGTESIVNIGGGISQFVFTAINTSHQLRAVNQQTTINGTSFFDNISVKEALPDRSYKTKPLSILGTLTKSQVATAAQLVAFSGFSAVNYLQEPFSSDLDMGTGSFSVSSWVNVPAVLPVSSFPVTGKELVINGNFNTEDISGYSANRSSLSVVSSQLVVTRTSADSQYGVYVPASITSGKTYQITFDHVNQTGASALAVFNGIGVQLIGVSEFPPKTFTSIFLATSSQSIIYIRRAGNGTNGETFTVDNISVKEVDAAIILDRSAANGSSFKVGVNFGGSLVASIFDGTTTRTVTSPAAYNNGSWVHASAEYVAGALKLKINGVQVAKTTGAALLTLNNSLAVATVGNNFALNAPFPGSLALTKVSATIPTDEQSVWMYEQEKQMFRDGVQCCLPDSNVINDFAYDELLDKWTAVSSTNESSFTGLVRTSTSPVSAGAISKVSTQSGVKLLARISTSPGVDITIPAQGLREELVRRSEAAAAQSKTLTVFDYDAIAAQTDFVLPLGFTATGVLSAGSSKREGSTKDFTRLFDGFKETIRFAVAPGAAVWVQITSKKA